MTCIEPEEIERLVARQTIEIAPLAYMRGRTLGSAFVIPGRSAEYDDGADVHVADPHWL